ncbi:MAG: glycosyltransferase [Caulobacteraceae bacterium]
MWTEALHKGGGFKRLKDVLADDFELGRMMREQGLSIACPPMLIDHGFPERTLGELWRHEMRWARTIRLLNPGGYIGSVITYVTPLALIGALLTGFSSFAVTTLIALAVVRLALAALSCLEMKAGLSVVCGCSRCADVLAFAVFVAAFFGDGVEWRGARLRVKPDGAMASPSMSETEILDKPSKAKTTAMIAAVAGLGDRHRRDRLFQRRQGAGRRRPDRLGRLSRGDRRPGGAVRAAGPGLVGGRSQRAFFQIPCVHVGPHRAGRRPRTCCRSRRSAGW